MLAAARIGAVVVPFSTFATAPELRDQLVHSDTEILLVAPVGSAATTIVARLGASVDRDRLRCGTSSSTHRTSRRTRRRCCRRWKTTSTAAIALAIIYTSGSTGAPKGAVHTHASLLGHQRNLNEIRGLTADDRLFCNSPFFWIGGFAFGLLATLVAGSTLVCSNATDAGRDPRSARDRAAHRDERLRRRHRASRPPSQLRGPRPVVDAPRQPVPDHGARRPAAPIPSCGTTCWG